MTSESHSPRPPNGPVPPILVTGGTGTLGRLVVALLRERELDVRVLSRNPHPGAPGLTFVEGDLVKDRHVGAAVAGIDTVIHCAGGPKHDDTAASNLVRHATKVGVGHLVFVSVIGADRVPLGYFRRKAEVERIIADSAIAWSGVRSAQFHDFVADLAGKAAKLPVIPLPKVIRFQPIEPAVVAAKLVGLALASPTFVLADMVGPAKLPMIDLVRSALDAAGKRRLIVPIPFLGAAGRAYSEGANLSLAPDAGGQTWDDFLRAGRPEHARITAQR